MSQQIGTTGLLPRSATGQAQASQGPKQTPKKPRKVATTIRLDPDLKNWAKSVAEHAGTDISTFITISLTDIRNGNRPSPLDPKLIAYNKYLDDMTDRIDRGEEEVSGPFSTWEETEKHLLSLSK